MKSLINTFFGLTIFVCSNNYAGAVTSVPLNNFTCESSLCLPVLPDDNGFTQMTVPNTFDFTGTISNKLYFRVNYLNNSAQCYKAAFSINCTFSYNIYGPFQNENDLSFCATLNSYLLTPLRTGTHNSGSAFEPLLTNDNVGVYLFEFIPNNCNSGSVIYQNWSNENCFQPCNTLDCKNCVVSFQPGPGDYVVSAWVKESSNNNQTTTYVNSRLVISFEGDNMPAPYVLLPSGQIIDGWQRIEAVITIPAGATQIHIDFEALNTNVNSYFDDVRLFPFDGSMVSYVYDPLTYRLMAQLDERNYAVFYEYDEEGHLVRVKRETERGIMTIEENRTNIRRVNTD